MDVGLEGLAKLKDDRITIDDGNGNRRLFDRIERRRQKTLVGHPGLVMAFGDWGNRKVCILFLRHVSARMEMAGKESLSLNWQGYLRKDPRGSGTSLGEESAIGCCTRYI